MVYHNEYSFNTYRCHPALTKLYFIWVTPSGNDYEVCVTEYIIQWILWTLLIIQWFTDFLSDIIEDKHVQRYLDIRIFLTNINSPPDELASALLHLALKTGGPALSVRRPSQPQLSKLYSNTSYGVPDFESLLDCEFHVNITLYLMLLSSFHSCLNATRNCIRSRDWVWNIYYWYTTLYNGF